MTHSPGYEAQAEWFIRLRAEWFRRLRPLGSWVPWELRDHVELEETDVRPLGVHSVIHPAPELREEHLCHCTLVPNRQTLVTKLPKGGVVAEVGVSQGVFSRVILDAAMPSQLHLIDHLSHPRLGELASDPRHADIVRLHVGDSADTLDSFDDNYFDWIYIDAQHHYEGVKRDAAVARRKVKRDGFLVFNDYTVWSYVEMQPYGVVAAVNELCIEDRWELIHMALSSDMYCDVAIRRIPA